MPASALVWLNSADGVSSLKKALRLIDRCVS